MKQTINCFIAPKSVFIVTKVLITLLFSIYPLNCLLKFALCLLLLCRWKVRRGTASRILLSQIERAPLVLKILMLSHSTNLIATVKVTTVEADHPSLLIVLLVISIVNWKLSRPFWFFTFIFQSLVWVVSRHTCQLLLLFAAILAKCRGRILAKWWHFPHQVGWARLRSRSRCNQKWPTSSIIICLVVLNVFLCLSWLCWNIAHPASQIYIFLQAGVVC